MAAAQLEREGNTFRLGDYPSACAVLRRRGPTSASAHRGRSASHPRAESAPAEHPARSRPLAVMQTESEGGTCRATSQASMVAGRELGFSGRDTGSKIDGATALKPRSQLPTESQSNGSAEGSRPQRRQSAYPRSGRPYQQHRGVCCTRRGVFPHSKSTKVLRNIISSQLRKPTFRASVNGRNSCARSGKGHLFPAAGWKTSSRRASERGKDVSSSNTRSWLEMKAVNCCRYWTITQSDELRGSATLPADCGDPSLSREISVRISFSSSNAALMSSVLRNFLHTMRQLSNENIPQTRLSESFSAVGWKIEAGGEPVPQLAGRNVRSR